MRINNKFIISLALAFTLVNTLLVLLGLNDLSIYYSAGSIVYLIVALFFTNSNFNPKAKSSVEVVSALIFFGFFITLGVRLYQIAQL